MFVANMCSKTDVGETSNEFPQKYQKSLIIVCTTLEIVPKSISAEGGYSMSVELVDKANSTATQICS